MIVVILIILRNVGPDKPYQTAYNSFVRFPINNVIVIVASVSGNDVKLIAVKLVRGN